MNVVNLILAADVVKKSVHKKAPCSSRVQFVGLPSNQTTGPRLFLYGPLQKLNKRVLSCSANVAGTNRNSDLKKVQ
jgi:hypothetical protein